MSQLLVGVGREVSTPEIGALLAGYAPRPSTSVNDDLHITAFAFETNGNRAMLISADMCNIRDDTLVAVQNAMEEASGLPMGNLILACTHTHSGPSCYDTHYISTIFIPALKKAIHTALSSMKPALMGIGTTHSEVAINRREIKENGKVALGQNPFGSFDPTMTVVSFREPNGTPIGNLIHYGCHNTAAGSNPEITRDWCGVAVDRLEALSGGITCFFNGCGGDCGPRLTTGKTSGGNNIALAMELGGHAASDAVRAWRSISIWHDAPLHVLCEDIALPLRKLPSLEEMYQQKGKMESDNSSHFIDKGTYNILLERIAYLEAGTVPAATKPISTSLICIGPVAFLPIPFEPFSMITLRIKQASPYPYTLCVGYANGAYSYFPSIDQIPRGGYEVEMFQTRNTVPFDDDSEQYFVTGSLRMLRTSHTGSLSEAVTY